MLMNGNAYDNSNFDKDMICDIILKVIQINPKTIKGLKIILSKFVIKNLKLNVSLPITKTPFLINNWAAALKITVKTMKKK